MRMKAVSDTCSAVFELSRFSIGELAAVRIKRRAVAITPDASSLAICSVIGLSTLCRVLRPEGPAPLRETPEYQGASYSSKNFRILIAALIRRKSTLA